MSWSTVQIDVEVEVRWLHHSFFVVCAGRCDVHNHLKVVCLAEQSNKSGMGFHSRQLV